MVCISVINKCLSLGLWSRTRSRQAKRRIAKLLEWEALRSVLGHIEGKHESVCFELEARMDSFAAVPAMLGRSSMYKSSAADQGG